MRRMSTTLWAFAALVCTEPADTRPQDDPTVEDSGTVATDPPTTDTGGGDTGSPGHTETTTEVFAYATPLADVLFVVDHSFSMLDNVEVLIGGLDTLVATWTELGIDFHAGAVDIDDSPDLGKLKVVDGYRWADTTHPDPGVLLRKLVDSVEDPSGTEAGRLATYKALELTAPGAFNEGFLRDGSQVAVVVITDETDQTPEGTVTPQEVIDYLLALRSSPDLVAFHSIVDSTDYLEMTMAVGGVSWSVESTPYGPVLDAITDTLARGNVFALSEAAVAESIAVVVEEPDGAVTTLLADDVSYDETALTVDLAPYVPQDGAEVEITYAPVATD